ncbi:MAG TPA: TetR/AcrR family transcriptional regulator [Solirubrobacterales bacterium]|nr:TetR/AcrR family transcriptional regulator [Solirubrobacterales bacterium]
MSEDSRPQKHRTATTRAAVLDATIELLVERGYAGTSTRLAAETAGVSLGALQHHFRTKAELTVEAMRFVTNRLAEEFIQAIPETDDLLERFGFALDRLFVVFRGPTFAAAMELHLAARTDPSLREKMVQLHFDDRQLIRDSAVLLMPGVEGRPGFDAFLLVSVSAIRGMAVATMGVDDVEGEWQAVKGQLLESATELLNRESA